ncbi:MAG TPA: class I SAM-dependent methyltransferase [Thermoanaerobaculia bacterium]|jgi:SAM-dependent methyltransferase|nr:class I SAM-dependent methyltransferase [Thermoanaerobaculia bacterium]
MPPAVLVPTFDHDALEERYAYWQSQMLLRRELGTLVYYDRDETAACASDGIEEPFVVVVTDPLLLPSARLGERLQSALGDAFAAVPSANQSDEPRQKVDVAPYMTLREFEARAAALDGATERIQWESHDPGVFLCATESLRHLTEPLCRVLNGRDVAVARNVLIHRWASLRGQTRHDLLSRISPAAKNILEFGCGEAPLGRALKERQTCRVVGVELDRDAAAIARKRIDDVYCGDVREIVSILKEKFDCIVGGDIVEHLDEPWSFLADLRNISTPGGTLLLSLPNVAHASIIADLLHGRFDYVYMGLTCVGHLRFMTRQSIEDMLSIARWEVVSIEPQSLAISIEQAKLLEALRAANVPFVESDVAPTGFYVTARNPA